MMKISKKVRMRELPLFWYWHCDDAQECIKSHLQDICLQCGRAEPKVMLPERCDGCLAVCDDRKLK